MIATIASAPDREGRRAFGRSRRRAVPRSSHARWTPAPTRLDPLVALERGSAGRIGALLPIRYRRMAVSPFAYYRGTAAIMAADLAPTPIAGISTQLCGDAHCANFGAFATPGGKVVFEVNDFDETLTGPWEWDVKRLAASLVLAGRSGGVRESGARAAARAAVAAYRTRMGAYATMTALEIWTDTLGAGSVLALSAAADRRRVRSAGDPRAVQQRYLRLTDATEGGRRIVDEPPLVYHDDGLAGHFPDVAALIERYRSDLREDARCLVERYKLADWVVKVVGVGSVGTRCAAAPLLAGDDDPLILQIKEARPSVLEPSLGPSAHARPGERVVAGQRLMQTVADPFLGTADDAGRSYYLRQLRVIKGAPAVETLGASELAAYGAACGTALAIAHARCGDPVAIAGYLGSSERFDTAIGTFAVAYAAQVEEDFAAFGAALAAGRFGSHAAG